jgi:hypothetical protein
MDSIFTINTFMITFIPFLLESSPTLSALRRANEKDLQELPGTRGKAAHRKLHLIIKRLIRNESTDWRSNLHLWREYLQATMQEDSTIGIGFPAAEPAQRAAREPGSDPTMTAKRMRRRRPVGEWSRSGTGPVEMGRSTWS